MTSKAALTHLYLLDCGEFTKIGQSTYLKDRMYRIIEDLNGIQIRINESYIWEMDKPIAMGLEKTIINKYQESLYGHEVAVRETFYSGVKEEIRKDVNVYGEIFEQNIYEEKLSNYLTISYENGKAVLNRKYKMKAVRI